MEIVIDWLSSRDWVRTAAFLKDVFSCLSSIGILVIGVWGLRTWRKEIFLKAKIEPTQRLVVLINQIRTAYRKARWVFSIDMIQLITEKLENMKVALESANQDEEENYRKEAIDIIRLIANDAKKYDDELRELENEIEKAKLELELLTNVDITHYFLYLKALIREYSLKTMSISHASDIIARGGSPDHPDLLSIFNELKSFRIDDKTTETMNKITDESKAKLIEVLQG